MSTITRRSLILSGAGLATAAFVVPAEAATAAVSLHIASAGFIFGVTGGSGTLTFRGQRYPLRVGGISAGALIGVSATDLGWLRVPTSTLRATLRAFTRPSAPACRLPEAEAPRNCPTPTACRRHQRRGLDRRLGDGSGRHRVQRSFPRRHRGYLFSGRGRHVGRGRQKHGPAFQRQWRDLRLHGRQVGFSFSIDLSGMSISLA